ncbi:hypothetical protein PIB30_044035 [Stylosanthes scabra]|uniref:Remorin C-terminal domain-containing protein n=1 Tax=Stylosanthes scabra TaxID=79078 RepID=A0ABU6QFA9_9FABA|nr:hypothetical protein [Stylosanthes scabra]
MMKKSSVSSSSNNHLIGSFPSPGAPNYRAEKSMVMISSQKGWSSERVPKASTNTMRRHTMSGLTPFFNASGRTMPSKWDEAERWICSPPVPSSSSHSADVRHTSSQAHHYYHHHHQRRPKSISGPIVHNHGHNPPQMAAYYYNNSNHSYSPASAVPIRQGSLVVRNLVVGSPFSTGVLAPLAVSVQHYDHPLHDHSVYGYEIGDGMDSSRSPLLQGAPVCLQHPCDPSSPLSQDLLDMMNHDEDGMFSKRDKGTQMSPADGTESDLHSSPESSAASAIDQHGCHSPKLEVRDVQVDSQATVIRGSKRYATKSTKTESINKEFRENSTETSQFSSWDIEESASDISKLKREEAKIIAWENLQRAKAEAAIRKLEMKLEKKRSSSMDKILNKLRKAETKAENMRSSIPEHRATKNCKVFSFPIWSPVSCFSSHAVAD